MFVRQAVSAPSAKPANPDRLVQGFEPLPVIQVVDATTPEAEILDWFSAPPPRPKSPPGAASAARAPGQLASAKFAEFAAGLDGLLDHAYFWRRALLRRYNEPQRHYHTIRHIEAMLEGLEAHRDLVVEPQVVMLAILFHDAVYNPRRHDNEEASMRLFAQCAEDLELPQKMRSSVLHLIERTKTHDGYHAEHPDLPLFLDLDLEVVSRPPETYAQYVDSIRQEYIHVPKALFAHLRANVLRSFLERQTLYFTPRFIELHEKQARQNMAGEIKELEATSRRLSARAVVMAWKMKLYWKGMR